MPGGKAGPLTVTLNLMVTLSPAGKEPITTLTVSPDNAGAGWSTRKNGLPPPTFVEAFTVVLGNVMPEVGLEIFTELGAEAIVFVTFKFVLDTCIPTTRLV